VELIASKASKRNKQEIQIGFFDLCYFTPQNRYRRRRREQLFIDMLAHLAEDAPNQTLEMVV